MAVCRDRMKRNKLDAALWTFSDSSFIGHGQTSDSDINFGRQPVLISDKIDNLNSAQALILLNGCDAPVDSNFVRIMVVFEDGDDSTIATARKQFKRAKEGQHAVNYFKQNSKGVWEKKV